MMNVSRHISFLTTVLLAMLLPCMLTAQRGNVVIPILSSVSVPQGASICADTIFANGPGHGTLTLADPSGVCSGTVVIPVELLRFSASLSNGDVLLSWTTATETQNFGFEVQRRSQHGEWTARGFVRGAGSSTRSQAYAFTDDCSGLPVQDSGLRYRLKQIDLNGAYTYSPEVEVRLDQPLPRFALEGYPVPCDKTLTVRLSMETAGATSIRLHDLIGHAVKTVTEDASLQAGQHRLRVRTDELRSGVYLLVVESPAGRRTQKVVVRH